MAESQISARFERAVYTSQFEQRGHYRQIIDPGALEQIKQEFTLDDSDSPHVQEKAAKPTYHQKRVAKIIDVSEGIKTEDSDVFSSQTPAAPKGRSVSYGTPQQLLYQQSGAKLMQLRPGIGVSKLRDMDMSRLPELNLKYNEQYFKRIRKSLFAAEHVDDDEEAALPVKPGKSVETVQT